MDKMAELAASKGVRVMRYSRRDVQAAFKRMGVHKKYDIARAVTKLVPALAPRLPARRGYGDREKYGMGIFEAAALALTYFYRA